MPLRIPPRAHLWVLPLCSLLACDGGDGAGRVAVPEASAAAGNESQPAPRGGASADPSSQREGQGGLPAQPGLGHPSAAETSEAPAAILCATSCGDAGVCDPASGGCVAHCGRTACLDGWVCDGGTGLCVRARPACGECRAGQVCDPTIELCLTHCSWVGCTEGRCDKASGYCVE